MRATAVVDAILNRRFAHAVILAIVRRREPIQAERHLADRGA
jgi:hypothetical protein